MLQSSVDPTQLSKTVEGVLMSFSGVILLIAAHWGFSLTTDQFASAVGNVGQIVFAGASAWGAAQALFGLFRKGVVAAGSVRK